MIASPISMPAIHSGIDLIEIGRIRQAVERYGERFLERVYTPQELVESRRRFDSLAAQFAAKEAVSKALGTGIGPVGWRDMEILHAPSGEPRLILYGAAQARAQQLNITVWSISLSHTKEYAAAVAVALSNSVP